MDIIDSIKCRMKDCKRNNFLDLDFSNLELFTFPILPSKYKSKIESLYLSENNLSTLPDLSDYISLKILDISHNKIDSLDKLPSTLIEISCRSNRLKTIINCQHQCQNLERLDCSSNNISEIPKCQKLKHLDCSDNIVNSIPILLNLEKLICENNHITVIESCPNLKYLNCSFNKLSKLADYDRLIDLLCNNNMLSSLHSYKNIKYLEICNNKINIVPYMINLNELLCDKNSTKNLSRKYIDCNKIDAKVMKNNIVHLLFTKKT